MRNVVRSVLFTSLCFFGGTVHANDFCEIKAMQWGSPGASFIDANADAKADSLLVLHLMLNDLIVSFVRMECEFNQRGLR